MKNTTINKTTTEMIITTTTTINMSTSAVKRLKQYFELHADEVIDIDTLSKVAGIRDWTRAIRFVRSKYKMNISYVADFEGYIYTKALPKVA